MSEFNIRFFAYKRLYKQKELLLREVSWSNAVANYLSFNNPKKYPKNINKFWAIDGTNNVDEDKRKQLIDMFKKDVEAYKNRNNK